MTPREPDLAMRQVMRLLNIGRQALRNLHQIKKHSPLAY